MENVNTLEETTNLFKEEFDSSIFIEKIHFDVLEDDGYGNSHYKGLINLTYDSIEFDIKRVNREVEEVVFKINNRDSKFFDENKDTRMCGIQERENIFVSYMMNRMKGYRTLKTFPRHVQPDPVKKWYQF